MFGNIDYFLTNKTKLAFGLRLENWDSKYKDSNNESFSPSDNMSGGKISIVKKTSTNSKLGQSFRDGKFEFPHALKK